jgi:hypothetical protein
MVSIAVQTFTVDVLDRLPLAQLGLGIGRPQGSRLRRQVVGCLATEQVDEDLGGHRGSIAGTSSYNSRGPI